MKRTVICVGKQTHDGCAYNISAHHICFNVTVEGPRSGSIVGRYDTGAPLFWGEEFALVNRKMQLGYMQLSQEGGPWINFGYSLVVLWWARVELHMWQWNVWRKVVFICSQEWGNYYHIY